MRARQPVTNDSLFRPAVGDAISLLLVSSKVGRVLAQVAGTDWLEACRTHSGFDLMENVVALSWTLDKVQISYQISAWNYIDWATLRLSSSKLEEDHGHEIAATVERWSAESFTKDELELLSDFDGKIALEVLVSTLTNYRPLGIKARKEIDAEHLLDLLIVSFNHVDLETDDLFWQLRQWERRNASYPLLGQWRQLDSLGMLLDQRYWENDLKKLISFDSKGEGLVAFKVDLDNFKSVNEKLGHGGGDEAIRIACRILRECLAEFAEVYRRGGDELVAIAPGLPGLRAVDLGERVRHRIEKAMKIFGLERDLNIFPTASIGIVDVPAGSDFNSVVAKMDETQQRAKDQGKNCVVFDKC